MGTCEVIRFGSDSELARTVAGEWLHSLPAAPQKCAFSGGRIAVTLFHEIVKQAAPHTVPGERDIVRIVLPPQPVSLRPVPLSLGERDGVRGGTSLDQVQFFFADERCVPPDHPESNYRLMRENLIQPLQIPAARVHRIRGEDEPHTAAKAAAAELVAVGPVLDYVFLGMGEDGHVASIFPGDKAAFTDDAVYRAVTAPKPPPQRITIGLNVIQQARNVWVLISGAGKEAALAESLKPDGRTPLALVIQGRRATRIFAHL